MEFKTIFWWVLLLGIVIAVIYFKLNKIKILGKTGEWILSKRYFKKLSSEYQVINDVLIKTEYSTSQIDHVIVSPYGIFVIETKSYEGLIRGDEYSKVWRQYIWKKYFNFKNPIHQNYGHVQALKTILQDIPDSCFVSIVVFMKMAKLNVDMKSDKKVHVVRSPEAVDYIMHYREKVFDEDKVKLIIEKIKENNIQNRKNLKEHIKIIKSKK